MDAKDLRPIVKEVLEGLIGAEGSSSAPAGRGAALISADDVTKARSKGRLHVPDGAIVTPLARDAAERFGVTLVGREGAHESASLPSSRDQYEQAYSASPDQTGGVLAIGSDHGGFPLKEKLRAALARRGRYEIRDCGSFDREACDYPDFAAAVARMVAIGDAQFGVIIDGAGIGSCMAANKFPGVLAANCHSVATAKNSREHNGANVLCLGSGHLDEAAATDILEAWLATAFGGGRHGRRVAKIRAIERSFLGGEA